MNIKRYNLINLKDTKALAKALADHLRHHSKQLVFLEGDLGVGKTTLVQNILNSLGIKERIKSPTYTLIEPYQTPEGTKVYHIDLYRIHDVNELEHLELGDLFGESAWFFIEWPQKLNTYGIQPDIVVKMSLLKDGSRSVVIEI